MAVRRGTRGNADRGGPGLDVLPYFRDMMDNEEEDVVSAIRGLGCL